MTYPSDISQEQFEKIQPILESARKKTRPRILDLHSIFNAVMYVVHTGCQWRSLPKDYPKWRSVHHYFLVWSEEDKDGSSVLDRVLKKMGRTRTYETWKKAQDVYGYRRRSECQKHGYRSLERL